MPLEYEAGAGPSREERSLRQELFDLHELAAEHFHQAFKGPGAAGEFMRAYWTEQRRFPAELADEFKIGAADENGGELAAALLRQEVLRGGAAPVRPVLRAARRRCPSCSARSSTASAAG